MRIKENIFVYMVQNIMPTTAATMLLFSPVTNFNWHLFFHIMLPFCLTLWRWKLIWSFNSKIMEPFSQALTWNPQKVNINIYVVVVVVMKSSQSSESCHATHTRINQPHFFCISLKQSKFNLSSFFPRTTLWNRLLTGFFPITIILTTSNLGLTVIFSM